MKAAGSKSKRWLDQEVIGKILTRAIEKMFAFINADLSTADENSFLSTVRNYASFICAYEFKYRFLRFDERYALYAGDLLLTASPKDLPARKKAFSEIQAHLRSKIQAIIDIAEGRSQNYEIARMVGVRIITADPVTDRFWSEFSFKETGREFNIEHEKKLCDLIFSDIVEDFRLVPSRFKQCTRCTNYFYQVSSSKRTFCSSRCSGADRQERFSEKKKKRLRRV